MNHKYIVALRTGGLMEDPEISYTNYWVISAENPHMAEEIYNNRNNCSFYYGVTLKEIPSDIPEGPISKWTAMKYFGGMPCFMNS